MQYINFIIKNKNSFIYFKIIKFENFIKFNYIINNISKKLI